MKKVYLQPSVEIVDIELNTTMMSASNNVPVDPNEKDKFNTNDRRGGWGTLWD